MQVRSIVLAGFAGIIALALVYLSVKVNASPATGATDQELAQARAFHKRNKRGTASVTTRPPTSFRSKPRVNRRTPRTKPTTAKRDRTSSVSKNMWNRPRTKPMRKLSLKGKNRGTELREKMREANKAYDRQDYDEATKQALEILKTHPRNIRMLRVMVSSSCFMGEADTAKKYYAKLPKRDKAHMRIRCSRMKIKLDE